MKVYFCYFSPLLIAQVKQQVAYLDHSAGKTDMSVNRKKQRACQFNISSETKSVHAQVYSTVNALADCQRKSQ